MKRLLFLLLVLAFVLSSCSGGDKPEESDPVITDVEMTDSTEADTVEETFADTSASSENETKEEKQEVQTAHVHTPKTVVSKASTCTETGLTEGSVCSSCGEILIAQQSVSATGHTRTTKDDGSIYCSDCGIFFVKMYNATYELGTIAAKNGVAGGNNTRFRTTEFIPIDEFQIITIEKGYQITWLAYDAEKNYMGNGANVYPTLPDAGAWLSDGQGIDAEEILEWNSDVKYLRFAFCRTDGGVINVAEDVKSSNVKIYSFGYEPEPAKVYTYEYSGASLGTTNTVECTQVASVSGLQDGAYYGDYIFTFSGEGVCKVYSANRYRLVSQFTLDKVSVFKPHCNSACFGTLKYDKNDEFPLLYVNIYNNYGTSNTDMKGACGVYRIVRNGTTFKTTLVQVIKVGFTEDTELWSSPTSDARPYGNFVIDTDRNKLIAFTMRDADRTTRFFEFDVPSLDAGTYDATLGVNKVILTKEDIKDKFSTAYFRYLQGCTYYNGRIYSLEGFTDDSYNHPAIKIVDLKTKTVLTEINLYAMGLTVEPEAIYVKDGVLYYAEVTGGIYKVDFK